MKMQRTQPLAPVTLSVTHEIDVLDEIEISDSGACKFYTPNQQEVPTEDMKSRPSATFKNGG